MMLNHLQSKVPVSDGGKLLTAAQPNYINAKHSQEPACVTVNQGNFANERVYA